jgi:hypothetical protein
MLAAVQQSSGFLRSFATGLVPGVTVKNCPCLYVIQSMHFD